MQRNWAGNITYEPGSVVRPTTIDELAHTVAAAAAAGTTVRALGSRHSFSRIADADTIVDTTALPEQLEVAPDRSTVTVNGAMTYGRLAELLAPLGLAVRNLASLPHISIAGAVSTGTHGSGTRNGNLATSVAAISLLTSDGTIRSLARGEEGFAGSVVSLGALGVMTSVTLDVVPAFEVAQRVHLGSPIAETVERFDEIFAAGYSVSVFTRWQGIADQIWVKHRIGDAEQPAPGPEAPTKLHPIASGDPAACTEQFGVPGLWADRLPHFRMDFTPSSGQEIQSEFFVDLADGPAAIEAVARLGDDLQDALMISELRTIAADDLWLSQSYGRPSLALHFTWLPVQAVADQAARTVADALANLSPRPHWGKSFDPQQFDLAQFERLDDYLSLVADFDPAGTFTNPWFSEVFAGHRSTPPTPPT